MQQNKQHFQADYFTEYYQPLTGRFTHSDLTRNYNWFYGWFEALQYFYDFSQGKDKKGKPKEVLEVGCAIGAACKILADRGFKVIGSDISSLAITKAKKLIKNVKFEQLDIERTKKYSKKFDVIYSFEVIEHLGYPEKALRNMRRMLKKDGILICSTPYPYDYVFFDRTHINVRHPLDWKRIFTNAGFKHIQYKQVGFVPFLYRFSKRFHIRLPFGLPTPYINSPVFIYAKKQS